MENEEEIQQKIKETFGEGIPFEEAFPKLYKNKIMKMSNKEIRLKFIGDSFFNKSKENIKKLAEQFQYDYIEYRHYVKFKSDYDIISDHLRLFYSICTNDEKKIEFINRAIIEVPPKNKFLEWTIYGRELRIKKEFSDLCFKLGIYEMCLDYQLPFEFGNILIIGPFEDLDSWKQHLIENSIEYDDSFFDDISDHIKNEVIIFKYLEKKPKLILL